MKHALMPSSYHKVNVSRYMLRHARDRSLIGIGKTLEFTFFNLSFFFSFFFFNIKLVLILTNAC